MRSRAFTLRRLLNGVIAAVLGLSWALFAATPAAAEQKAELKALGEEQAELWRAFSAGVPGDDRPVTRF